MLFLKQVADHLRLLLSAVEVPARVASLI